MKRILYIAFIISSFCLQAQINPDIDLESFAERRFQMQDEDINYEDLYESLLLYYTNPINLNKTNRTELGSLYILNPIQLNSFFSYLEKHGKLLSLYELQAIPEFDLSTIRDLLPFVTVDEISDSRPLIQRITNEPNNYLLLRYTTDLETEAGYSKPDTAGGYLGNPGTIYGRFRVSHPDDFSLGFTFEKDAGEPLNFNNGHKGFDFYSGHFLLKNQGKFSTIAIGDYQIQQGQGLVFGAGFSAGKGAETVNSIKRNSLGIRPYASVLESGFFRGAAATYTLKKWSLTTMTSSILQDGQIISDSTFSDYDEFISTIQSTGMHRTPSELNGKNSLRESNLGWTVEYQPNAQLSIGSTGLFTQFSHPLQKKPNNYNQFEFSGNQNWISSMYANWNWQNFIFFGESARSKSGGIGAVGGLIASLTPKLDFSWSIRKYDRNFHSFYGNALSEGSRVINENGMYWGLKYQPSRKFQLMTYFDKFTFPWLKFRVNAPSEGFEYLFRFTYLPSRSVQLYAQFRQENKEWSYTEENGNLSQLATATKYNYIINADYSVGRIFSFKTRLQGSSYHQPESVTKGMALVQDINYSIWQFKLSTRFALFDTDDFNNRQYIYERNVLYAFGLPAYSGLGSRSYFLIQYTASSSVTLWMRYARFSYTNVEEIGSGLSQIEGNHQTELRVMMRYKFLK